MDIPAFAFPSEAGTRLPTPEGWNAELALGDLATCPMSCRCLSHCTLFLYVSVGAETDSEHIRLDLAVDEVVDLKRGATGTCYNREFVRVHWFVVCHLCQLFVV